MDSIVAERGVDARGPTDAPPVVFVHGVSFSRKMWLPQLRALDDEFRVVAFDLPGHATRADRRFTIAEAVRVLDRVVEEHADGRALVVGLSLGGYVAQAYASRSPDGAAGLVVSGASANPVGLTGLFTRLVAAAFGLGSRIGLVRRLFDRRVADFVREQPLDPAVAEDIVAEGFYMRPVADAGFELAGWDVHAAIPAYDGPMLVANGGADAINRRAEAAHVAAARDARVEVVRGARHTCTLEEPDQYARLVREFARTTSLVD